MPKYKPLEQFRAPYNFELAGKSFHLVMDDGSELSLVFLDGENLQWAERGKPYVWDTYECLKADDTTYFVHTMPAKDGGKINYCLILDLGQNLVTQVKTIENDIPESPRLIRVLTLFGAIKLPGRPLPEKRHFFTDAMAGRRITWHYNPGFAIQHIYYSPTFYRLPRYDLEGAKRQYAVETDPEEKTRLKAYVDRFERCQKAYPFGEEPCFHITINDHLNLFAFCEENELIYDPLHQVGGGGLILLQDIDRLTDVGLGYSLNEYYMVSAYGVEGFVPDEVESVKNPYDNTNLQSLPDIYKIHFDT